MPEGVFEQELEKLKKFDKNSKWVLTHYQELLERFKGKYVAVNDDQIMDSDKVLEDLIKRLKEKHGDISPVMIERIREQPVAYMV